MTRTARNRRRLDEALELRATGLTYREIGHKLGVTGTRAYQLVRLARRLKFLAATEQPDYGLWYLDFEASECLVCAGYTTRERVAELFKNGPPALKIDGLKAKQITAVMKWLSWGEFVDVAEFDEHIAAEALYVRLMCHDVPCAVQARPLRNGLETMYVVLVAEQLLRRARSVIDHVPASTPRRRFSRRAG